MDTRNKNINDVFSEKNYTIPFYQRPYCWLPQHMKELLNDLYDSFNTNEKHYYLGQIIVVKKDNNNNNNYDIIDGQQRLTSLLLIFGWVVNCPKLPDDFKKMVSHKLVKYELNREYKPINCRIVFDKKEEQQILFKKLFIEEQIPNNNNNNNNNQIIEKLINNYKEIESFMNSLNIDNVKLFHFISFILNNVTIDFTETSNFNNAVRIFFTSNNRGLDLRLIDLLKAFYAEKINNDIILRDKMINIFNKIDKNLDDESKDKFLKQYYFSLMKEDKCKDLKIRTKKFDTRYEDIYKHLTCIYGTIENSIEEHLNDLDRSIDLFLHIENPKEEYSNSISIFNLKLIGKYCKNDWISIIFAYNRSVYLQKYEKNLDKLYKNILLMNYNIFFKNLNSIIDPLNNRIVMDINNGKDFYKTISDKMKELYTNKIYKKDKHNILMKKNFKLQLLLIEFELSDKFVNYDPNEIYSKSTLYFHLYNKKKNNIDDLKIYHHLLIPRKLYSWNTKDKTYNKLKKSLKKLKNKIYDSELLKKYIEFLDEDDFDNCNCKYNEFITENIKKIKNKYKIKI